MFTVPVTRGSRMKNLPVCWPTVLITDWISALTKLTVIFSSSAARAGGPIPASKREAATMAAAARAAPRNFVTILGFSLDFSGGFPDKTVLQRPASRPDHAGKLEPGRAPL